MIETTLGIILQLKDNASAGLINFKNNLLSSGQAVKTVGTETPGLENLNGSLAQSQVGVNKLNTASINPTVSIQGVDTANVQLRSIEDSLIRNKAAIRELAMGTTFLGVSFMGMGTMLKQSNIEMVAGIGNVLNLVGGVMAFVGASASFISAISKMVNALKALNVQQVIANALSGPGGWAKLAIGGAVAGGMIYGISRMSQGGGTTINQTNNFHGTVLTEKQAGETLRREFIKTQQRNNTTGIR
jgi:hypothetical protein